MVRSMTGGQEPSGLVQQIGWWLVEHDSNRQRLVQRDLHCEDVPRRKRAVGSHMSDVFRADVANLRPTKVQCRKAAPRVTRYRPDVHAVVAELHLGWHDVAPRTTMTRVPERG